MNFNVKIADFGLSKFIDTQNYQMTSFMGTFVISKLILALDGTRDHKQ